MTRQMWWRLAALVSATLGGGASAGMAVSPAWAGGPAQAARIRTSGVGSLLCCLLVIAVIAAGIYLAVRASRNRRDGGGPGPGR